MNHMNTRQICRDYLEKIAIDNNNIIVNSLLLKKDLHFKCNTMVYELARLGVLQYINKSSNTKNYSVNLENLQQMRMNKIPKQSPHKRPRGLHNLHDDEPLLDLRLDKITEGWAKT